MDKHEPQPMDRQLFRETAEGGLAVTPTGLEAKKRIFGIKEEE